MFKFTPKLAISFICSCLMFSSCSENDPDPIEPEPIEVIVQDSHFTIDENPSVGEVIGVVDASTNVGAVSFEIESQVPEGALKIDPVSGELSVLDSALFDFEINPIITAVIKVVNEEESATANVEIEVKDVFEPVLISFFSQVPSLNGIEPNAEGAGGLENKSVRGYAITTSNEITITHMGLYHHQPATYELQIWDKNTKEKLLSAEIIHKGEDLMQYTKLTSPFTLQPGNYLMSVFLPHSRVSLYQNYFIENTSEESRTGDGITIEWQSYVSSSEDVTPESFPVAQGEPKINYGGTNTLEALIDFQYYKP